MTAACGPGADCPLPSSGSFEMFGYVIPPQDLPEEEMNRFRRAYCGLCHTLGRRYGPRAQMILNYDFTYLAILLSDPEEGERRRGRCVVHPRYGQEYLAPCAALELAADESVILAYWQLWDGVEDHGWLRGLKYRGGSAFLESACRKAAQVRPDFDRSTRCQLEQLAVLERENCPSMDRAADTFAVLLQGAARQIENPVRRRVLEQMLYHLGRWVYLVDAAEDLKKDAASANYNPISLRYGLPDGQWTSEAKQAFAATLDQSVYQMAAAFELWDFGVWTPILRETIYSGLFRVGKAVLDGTFRRRRNKGSSLPERETQERST